jgi:ABC-type dipeptide/oligopeptide/nickel transport system permease component
MLSFLLRRLFTSMLVIVGVVTLVFGVLRAVPGDPVASILGEEALELDKQALRDCLHLDESLPSQYAMFWRSVADGSLGELCDERGATVSGKLIENLPATAELALAALLVAILIAAPLGVASALRPRTWVDHTSAVVALAGISIPNFWLGPMLLILFSITLRALPDPGSGVTGLSALVLPAITLGSGLSAKLMRLLRSSLLESLSQDYIRTARAKGASEQRVVWRHAMRNALIPVTTVLGLQLGALLTGALIVEKVFARPGIGSLLLSAIEQRNYMIVQGCVLFIAAAYVLVNLLTDLLYGLIDPRIRYD